MVEQVGGSHTVLGAAAFACVCSRLCLPPAVAYCQYVCKLMCAMHALCCAVLCQLCRRCSCGLPPPIFA